MRLLYLTGRGTKAPRVCLFPHVEVSPRSIFRFFDPFSKCFFPSSFFSSSGFLARSSLLLTSPLIVLVFRHGPVACLYLVISHINSPLTMSRAHSRSRFARSANAIVYINQRRLLRHVARQEQSRTQRDDSDKELDLFLRFPSWHEHY